MEPAGEGGAALTLKVLGLVALGLVLLATGLWPLLVLGAGVYYAATRPVPARRAYSGRRRP